MSAATSISNPRRRARSPQPGGSNTIPTRDYRYYMDEGDCFIRVENTIFKLPRYLLIRGSSVFRDMFSLPQDAKMASQSFSENNPLVLQDDVEDFRALCWLFDAPPHEIVEQEDASRIDIRKIVSIFHLSDKYQFLDYEKWVVSLLERHCTREEEGGTFRNTQRCSILEYKRLLTLACIKENSKIKTHICNGWIDRLRTNATLSSKDALDFATSLNLREFQGRIYYNEIRRMKTDLLPNSTALQLYENNWDPEQILRLYHGSRSLSFFRDRLLSGPLPRPETGSDFVFGTPNLHLLACAQDWRYVWKTMTIIEDVPIFPGTNSDALILNPLESLEALSKLQLKSEFNLVTCRCLRFPSFASQAKYIHTCLSETLTDHFLGPLTPADST